MALATYLTGLTPARSQRWAHLNGDLHDFRLENLMLVARGGSDLQREAVSRATRARNRALRRAPEGRMIGVFNNKGWYYARISVPGAKTVRSLGRYRTAEEAGRAYDRARVEYGLPPVNFPE